MAKGFCCVKLLWLMIKYLSDIETVGEYLIVKFSATPGEITKDWILFEIVKSLSSKVEFPEIFSVL